MTHDYFDEPIAAAYDDPDDPRFSPEHLELETGFLAVQAGRGGPGGSAFELAIGTGRVAVPLAARGVEVAGVDLSEAMVRRLRDKPGGAAMEVAIGDYTTTRLPERLGTFDLAYLVFNTIGNVASQEGQVAAFVNAAAHLRPGGRFVLEVHVPGVSRVAPGERYRVFGHDDGYVGFDEYDAVTQQMWSHHYTTRPDGTYRRNSIPFRYAWPAELDLMARIAGMVPVERWGWWDRRPFTADSESHVSVWEKSAPR